MGDNLQQVGFNIPLRFIFKLCVCIQSQAKSVLSLGQVEKVAMKNAPPQTN
jgi:hypothetical protein